MSGPGFNPLARALGLLLERTRPDFPPLVRIETTNHCNADCVFCPRASMGRAKTFMSDALFRMIIDQCATVPATVVHLHNFGEPLLDKRLPQRIAHARVKGLSRLRLFTNGALLRGPMAEGLLDAGLEEIKVSIDGADRGEFNRLRVGLELDHILANLRRFKAMRDAGGHKGPRIVATCTLTSDRRRTRQLLADAVDRVLFTDYHNWAGDAAFSRRLRLRQPCERLWRTFTILADGNVALCHADHSGRTLLGNCLDQTIRQIWNSERHAGMRALHRASRQAEMELCRGCSMSFVQPAQLISGWAGRQGLGNAGISGDKQERKNG